jgi:hypothetical protein
MPVCRELMNITSPLMMKWIVCIILQDVRIGRSATTILKVRLCVRLCAVSMHKCTHTDTWYMLTDMPQGRW